MIGIVVPVVLDVGGALVRAVEPDGMSKYREVLVVISANAVSGLLAVAPVAVV